MKSIPLFAISGGLTVAAIAIGLFCNKYFKTVEYSAIVGYSFKELTWTREDLGRIVYNDDHIEDRFGEFLSPCSYDDFKTNVLSRLRCASGRTERKTCEYERLFKELSIHIGFANMPGKQVAVFSLKAHSEEDVAPFLDACAETAVQMYPISQNARFERSISLVRETVQKQERTIRRLEAEMQRNSQGKGETADKLLSDIEMAQKLYEDLRQKLEEHERLRGTILYQIKVIKRTTEVL